MPDSTISGLNPVSIIQNDDLFVLEQNAEAKKVTGQKFLEFASVNIINAEAETLVSDEEATAEFITPGNTLKLGIPRGHDARIDYIIIEYAEGSSPTVPPTSGWQTSIPYIEVDDQAVYLWTRNKTKFVGEDEITYYAVCRFGKDGRGAASDVLPLSDSPSGQIGTKEIYSREDHRHPTDTSRAKNGSVSQTGIAAIDESGFYHTNSTPAKLIIHCKWDGNYGIQLLNDYTGTRDILYFREKVSSVWGEATALNGIEKTGTASVNATSIDINFPTVPISKANDSRLDVYTSNLNIHPTSISVSENGSGSKVTLGLDLIPESVTFKVVMTLGLLPSSYWGGN